MISRLERWRDARWIFASTRNSLIAVALFVALPTALLSEVAVRASSDRIRADAQERTAAVAGEVAAQHAERITALAESVFDIASGPRLEDWVGRGASSGDSPALRELGSDIVGLVLVDTEANLVSSEPAWLGNAIVGDLRGPWDRVTPPLISKIQRGSVALRSYFAISVPVARKGAGGTLIAIADAERSARWAVGLLTAFDSVHIIDAAGVALDLSRIKAGEPAAVNATSLRMLEDRLYGSGLVAGTTWHVLVARSTAPIYREMAIVAGAERLIDVILVALIFVSSVLLARHMRRIMWQRERLRAVQAMAAVGGWEWDIWQDHVAVSSEVLRIYGLRPGEGKNTYEAVMQRIHPDDRARVEREIKRVLREGNDLSIRHRIVRPDGTVRIVETRGSVTGPQGRPTGMRGTAQDVTELMQAEEERSRLTALLDSAAEALVSTALDGTITSWNAGAEQMFGYCAVEAVGRPIGMLRPAARRDRPNQLLERARAGETVTDRETERERKDGSLAQVAVSVSPLRDPHGLLAGVAWTFRDVGALKRAEAELAHRASHDGLTGLPNRFLFQDRLDQALRAAERSARPLAVLALELDRFREINEAFGEGIGDAVLSDVSARLLEEARAIDTLARLSSDKFAVLIPEADREAAGHVAARLRTSLQRPIALAGKEVSVDLSVGIAVYPEHGEDATTLMRRADRAVSVAKRTGTGAFVYSTDLDQGTRDRAALVTELRRAIEDGQLILHYQPLVNMASGLILGVEALVRWDHPTRGRIPPSEFVPLAEHTSLMGALTRYVLTRALQEYRRWHEVGHALPVLVNISPRDLRDPSFVRTIEELHDTYRVSQKWLKLEITEGFVVDDPERAIATLQRMRELGILIALDDFGTGYSSLSYLGRLPVDAVKIDRSFVATMRSDPKNAAIVRATIGLAHTLGFGTVAEGVEDEATFALVKEMGSDMAQGYGIARPMPAEELDAWLRTSPWQPRPAPVDTAVRAWSVAPPVAAAAAD